MIWLYIPDFIQGGTLKSIEKIPIENKFLTDNIPITDLFWQQIDECSGFKISDKPCHLRTGEMELVHY